MEAVQVEEGACAVCAVTCTKKCLACMKVNYCCTDHQEEHSVFCYPVKIVVNDNATKSLVATRDIQREEIIFMEKPLITGPRQHKDWFTGKFPLCLECYNVVRGNYRCSKCLWPLCGLSCEKGTRHSTFECPIFASNNIEPIEKHETYHYSSICTLRGLLLKTIDPKKWEQLIELDSKQEQRKQDTNFDLLRRIPVEFIEKECRQTQFDNDEIDFVAGIVQVNRMSSEDNESSEASFGSYIYHKASFSSHSCIPNAMWFIQNNHDLQLRASIAIKKGELVTSSSVNLEDGTFPRLSNLKKLFIDCRCPRCLDVTELGTYMSAVKCRNSACSGDGYYLMENPLNENSLWRCNVCDHVENSVNVFCILSNIELEYTEVERAWSCKPNCNALESHVAHIKQLESFLNKHEGKTLHKNHSILFRCKQKLCHLIPIISFHMENEEERKALEVKHILLVKSCLDLANIFWPGSSRYRGQLLYALQRGLFCVIFSELETLKNSSDLYFNTQMVFQLQKVFRNILEIRKEVKSILGIESEGKVEKGYAKEMDFEGEDFTLLRRLINVPL